MAEARKTEFEDETTESYRGKVREVEHGADKNRPQDSSGRRESKPGSRQRRVRGGFKGRALNKLSGGNPAIAEKVAMVNAAAAMYMIITITAVIYPVQLAMAVLSLAALAALIGLDASWIGYADVFGWFSDFGQQLLFISLALVLVIGLLTFFIALGVFVARGVSVGRGISVVISAVCLSFYAAPVLNFLPWMWLWCLYVVKSQGEE